MIAEEDWARLVSGGRRGTSRRRLHPEAAPNLFLTVGFPGDMRMLVLMTDTQTATKYVQSGEKLPQTRGMEIRLVPGAPSGHELQLALTDRNLHEVFNPLVADIAETVAHDTSGQNPVRAFVSRFRRWVRLLESVGETGLSATDRRGLFGELTVLAELLDLGVTAPIAVGSWTGPKATDQDFQIADGAVEVKATTGRTKSVSIASERQLDDAGLAWLLLVHVALDERRGGTGLSLDGLVSQILARLDVGEQSLMWAHLVTFGYFPAHRDLYAEPRYTIRTRRLYDVRNGFPRIVERDLANGITDCAYRLDLAALESWSVGPEALSTRVDGPKREEKGTDD